MSEQASQRSVELFKSGYFCAESVLSAIAENQGHPIRTHSQNCDRVLQRHSAYRRNVRGCQRGDHGDQPGSRQKQPFRIN